MVASSPNTPSPALGRAVRHHWLLEEGMTFLNHGSFGATPRRVLSAQQHWRLQLERQPLRFMIDTLTPGLRSAASQLGDFLAVDGEDLAFVENATTGVNAVLRSLKLNTGDEVLTTTHVYGAVDKAIQFVCRRSGAVPVLVDVPFPIDGPAAVLEQIRTPGWSAQDQWSVHVQVLIQERAEIQVYSDNLSDEQIRGCHLTPCRDIEANVRAMLEKRPEGFHSIARRCKD